MRLGEMFYGLLLAAGNTLVANHYDTKHTLNVFDSKFTYTRERNKTIEVNETVVAEDFYDFCTRNENEINIFIHTYTQENGYMIIRNVLSLFNKLEEKGWQIMTDTLECCIHGYGKFTLNSNQHYSIVAFRNGEFAWVTDKLLFVDSVFDLLDCNLNYMRFIRTIGQGWCTEVYINREKLDSRFNAVSIGEDEEEVKAILIEDCRCAKKVEQLMVIENGNKVPVSTASVSTDNPISVTGWNAVMNEHDGLHRIRQACDLIDKNLFEQIGVILNYN